jgi:predicted nucleic acid-binding protein
MRGGMNDLVIDASSAVCALTGTTVTAAVLRERLASSRCHAPHLIDAEVGHALRRKLLNGQLSSDTAMVALRLLRNTVHTRYPHVGAVAELAWLMRENLTYYDALYVAVAAALRVPLLTLDSRLAGTPGLPCEVEVLIDQ